MVFLEPKVLRASKGLQEPFYQGPKARGVHLATQVFQVFQGNLVTLA